MTDVASAGNGENASAPAAAKAAPKDPWALISANRRYKAHAGLRATGV
jgi:hypothetical protein